MDKHLLLDIHAQWPEWTIVSQANAPTGYAACYRVARSHMRALLKLVRFEGNADIAKSRAEAFLRNVEAAGQLQAPASLLPIVNSRLSQSTAGGWNVFIMTEDVQTLVDYVRHNCLSPAQTIALGMDIARALDACHKHRYFHRHLTPESVYQGLNGRWQLGDVGVFMNLPVEPDPVFAPPSGLGLEPEQADVYALGRMLYRLALGIPLSSALTPQEHRYRSGAPVDVYGGPSSDLMQVVARACSLSEINRYPSAGVLLRDLQILAGLDTEPLKGSAFEQRGARSTRRHTFKSARRVPRPSSSDIDDSGTNRDERRTRRDAPIPEKPSFDPPSSLIQVEPVSNPQDFSSLTPEKRLRLKRMGPEDAARRLKKADEEKLPDAPETIPIWKLDRPAASEPATSPAALSSSAKNADRPDSDEDSIPPTVRLPVYMAPYMDASAPEPVGTGKKRRFGAPLRTGLIVLCALILLSALFAAGHLIISGRFSFAAIPEASEPEALRTPDEATPSPTSVP